jgi:hypothetical protein
VFNSEFNNFSSSFTIQINVGSSPNISFQSALPRLIPLSYNDFSSNFLCRLTNPIPFCLPLITGGDMLLYVSRLKDFYMPLILLVSYSFICISITAILLLNDLSNELRFTYKFPFSSAFYLDTTPIFLSIPFLVTSILTPLLISSLSETPVSPVLSKYYSQLDLSNLIL